MVRRPAHGVAVAHVLVAHQARGVDGAVLVAGVAAGGNADAVDHPEGLGVGEGEEEGEG